MRVPLGVLDQSPVISGHSPARAIAETVSLARLAEELGYHRYWLAEHHAIAALADPSPEILVSSVASATSRIRVGTGGVLLPYYSPLKVAEQFRMLEALFPGRIDLGIGRAPGGDPRTALALADGEYPGAEHMPQQVQDLIGFLDGSLPSDHPYAKVKAQPAGDTSPEVWLLGSSEYSGALAAQLGLRFAFAHFISAFGGEAVAARAASPVARLRVRDLRKDPGGGRAPRGEHRSPAPAHGERDRCTGADARGSERLPRLTAGARLHRAAARAPGARRSGRGAGKAAGDEGEVRGRRADAHHHHRRLREPADFVPPRSGGFCLALT